MNLSTFLLVGVVVAPSSFSLAQDAPPAFAGSWERDPKQSDDAAEKMRAALEQLREQMERRGGGPMGGGGPGGPPPEGPGGPGERGRGPRSGGGGVARVPDELRVELDRGELRVDDGERVQIYYLDGKKHLRQLPNGAKLETVSLLEGGVVHIEEKLARGKVERTIELGPDGKTMISTLNVKMKEMKNAVVIRTVYVRVEEGVLQ
jgi:hypothetical protein